MRLRRPLLFGSIAGIVVIGAVTLTFQFRVDARWDAMTRDANALEQLLAIDDGTRPVLFGESAAGNAWDDYTIAIQALPAQSEAARSEIIRARKLEPVADTGKLREAYVRAHLPALQAMQRGAHRTLARLPIQWPAGYARRATNLLTVRNLANACVLAAEQHIDAREPERAVDLLLDAMQFGRDLTLTPLVIDEIIGVAILQIASKEALVQNGLMDRLTDAALRRLAAGMRVLDESLPSTSLARHGELLLFARSVQSPKLAGMLGGPGPVASWRFCFSPRLMFAMSFAERLAHVSSMHDMKAEPWSIRRAQMDEVSETWRTSKNPMTACCGSLDQAEVTRRYGIFLLRATRMLVEFRLSHQCTPLPDPFGTTIAWKIEGDAIRVTSEGARHESLPSDSVEVPIVRAAAPGK